MRMPLVWIAGAITLVLAIVIAFEPVSGDGWAGWLSARGTRLSWDGLLELARYEHASNNPRWGQLVLAVSYHHRAIAIILTPLAITGTVLLAMTLVRGRWPRASERVDAWLFVCLFAALAISTPKVGLVWFYRPSCANYVYPLVVQLAWLVPYRALLERPGPRPVVTALVVIPLGALAGAGNEHTGPALAAAALACTVVAWRRDRRLPLWTVAGIVALIAGCVFLLTAPAQSVRYNQLAQHHSLLSPLVERGVTGVLAIVGRQLAWAAPMAIVLVIAARAVGWPRIDAARLTIAKGALVTAGLVIVTALVSPKLPARLLAAPAAMIAIAMGSVIVELSRYARAATIVRASCVVIAGAVLAYALVVHVVTGREWRDRVVLLDGARPGSTVDVPRYTFARPWWISYGDDLRSATLRARLERRLGVTLRWR